MTIPRDGGVVGCDATPELVLVWEYDPTCFKPFLTDFSSSCSDGRV
jgi:hypothetical protein